MKDQKDAIESLLKSLELAANPLALLEKKYGPQISAAVHRVMTFMTAKGYTKPESDFKIGIEDNIMFVAKIGSEGPILVVEVLNNLVHVDVTGHYGTVRTREAYMEKQKAVNEVKRQIYAEEIAEAATWEEVEGSRLAEEQLDTRLETFDPNGKYSN